MLDGDTVDHHEVCLEGSQEADEHHTHCPICGHMVDEFDLEEVLQHLEAAKGPATVQLWTFYLDDGRL